MTPSPATNGPIAQPQGNGVYLIDTLYLRPGLAASHLVVDDGRAAPVSTNAALPQIMEPTGAASPFDRHS